MLGTSFNLLDFIFGLAALIVAIDIHEFSHAWAAEHLGDPTPRLQGRLTLNPLAHLDPIGTILLILVRFGWGKPVQFDPFNLRNPRRDSALISIAGPVSNILMAAVCAILIQLLIHIPAPGSLFIMIAGALLQQIIVMNIVLGIFNLVPIHPLDGFKIVEGILPEQQAHEWHELERFGIIFLIFLLFPIFGGVAPIQRVISPVIDGIINFLLPAAPLL
jgi:Zn-dependent protease